MYEHEAWIFELCIVIFTECMHRIAARAGSYLPHKYVGIDSSA